MNEWGVFALVGMMISFIFLMCCLLSSYLLKVQADNISNKELWIRLILMFVLGLVPALYILLVSLRGTLKELRLIHFFG